MREDAIAELQFDLQGESVNKLNRETLEELDQALDALEKEASAKGKNAQADNYLADALKKRVETAKLLREFKMMGSTVGLDRFQRITDFRVGHSEVPDDSRYKTVNIYSLSASSWRRCPLA